MGETLQPADSAQLREAVAWAVAREQALEIHGAGTKAALGRPVEAPCRLDLSALSGISFYEPTELVMTVAAATPLAEVTARLAQHNQHLAFEPADYGPLWGKGPDGATMGGVLACNLSGPRRIAAGAARDHFLGFQAVSGRGEAFKSGGRVVKNVTGYDMCKLMAGSYGTLAVLSEVTFKVMPAPETLCTLVLPGLSPSQAVDAMTAALQSPFDVSGAAHLPSAVAADFATGNNLGNSDSATVLRLEGPAPSVAARSTSLRQLLSPFGHCALLEDTDSQDLWRGVRDVVPFQNGKGLLWRISAPPSVGLVLAEQMAVRFGGRYFCDWGGGLIWLALDGEALTEEDASNGGALALRKALGERGEDLAGHALLLRAPQDLRREVAVFQPQSPELAKLTARMKQGFDPAGILNPGRMYDGV
ncbi:MAG: glycolate oxidase subunit GlcE [Alphaproteobacteria bacterium]|nr:glycolate oxidase subunit GlcE [Alphaproteobacteria bacterium]